MLVLLRSETFQLQNSYSPQKTNISLEPTRFLRQLTLVSRRCKACGSTPLFGCSSSKIMSNRKAISKDITVSVLTRSRRRCALCFGLRGDLQEKKGQIAHLDRNPANNNENNLIYLCLEHHDQYDSSTSQSKGLTREELLAYQTKLYLAIETGLNALLPERAIKNNETITHDQEIFERSNSIMCERELKDFLDTLQTRDAYLRNQRAKLVYYRYFFDEVGNYFLVSKLAASTKALLQALSNLLEFTATHFFMYPNEMIADDYQYAMYPNLNMDRQGNGSIEEMKKYGKFQSELNDHCRLVRDVYKMNRLTIKRLLLR
jgi:hypothetical protein